MTPMAKNPSQLSNVASSITYPVIASVVLERLFAGKTRSSDLTEDIGFSAKLVYLTIEEMIKEGLVTVETDRPKFKVYGLTEKGKEMVNDAVIKSSDKLVELILNSPKTYEIVIEAVSELLCRNLEPPTKESIKPLMKEMMKEKYTEIEKKREKILEITAT